MHSINLSNLHNFKLYTNASSHACMYVCIKRNLQENTNSASATKLIYANNIYLELVSFLICGQLVSAINVSIENFADSKMTHTKPHANIYIYMYLTWVGWRFKGNKSMRIYHKSKWNFIGGEFKQRNQEVESYAHTRTKIYFSDIYVYIQ